MTGEKDGLDGMRRRLYAYALEVIEDGVAHPTGRPADSAYISGSDVIDTEKGGLVGRIEVYIHVFGTPLDERVERLREVLVKGRDA